MSAEAKVGLLVIVVALLAVVVAVFLSDALRTWRSYHISIQFANVQGLESGGRVRLGGVGIGTVQDVSIRPHPDFPGKPVAVDCIIEPDTILYATDVFTIQQGALVGDKYVSITRPEKKAARTRLQDGAVVGGGGASGAEIVMNEAQRLIEAAHVSVDAVNAVLTDMQLQEDFKATVSNLRSATERAVVVSDSATRLVDSLTRISTANQAKIAGMMQNLVGASEEIATATRNVQSLIKVSPVPAQMAAAGENIRLASEDLRAVAGEARQQFEGSSVSENLDATMANLREASDSLREMSAGAAALATDQQLATDIRATAENTRAASASLRAAAEHTESFITDEEINEDLRDTISTLHSTVETSQETIERADRVMTDIENTLASVRHTQEIITNIDTRARVQLLQAEDEGFRADAAFDLRPEPDSDAYWRVGLRDIGDQDSLDLQFAQRHGAGTTRVGLFGGTLGLGYDYRTSRSAALEAEAYNPDDLRLDLRLRLTIQREYGLLLGLDRALAESNPMIGVRYQGDF